MTTITDFLVTWEFSSRNDKFDFNTHTHFLKVTNGLTPIIIMNLNLRLFSVLSIESLLFLPRASAHMG